MTTYVLIPGAGGEAWYWHRVVPELASRGHDAIAVELPAGDDDAGWAEYADAIERTIGDRRGLILVAQSLAGFSAPIVADRRKVDLLVLVNAMIPQPGETGGDWWSNTRSREAQLEYFAKIGLAPEAADDNRTLYFHDVPRDVVDEAYRRGDPAQSSTPMGQPWPLDKWPDVPTRVLSGRDDRLFPAEFQRRIARGRLGLEADEIQGGHLVALSHPRELGERLESYRLNLGHPALTDDDLPPSEAARARRRDRDMDAERRELMRPGMAKVFRQVTDAGAKPPTPKQRKAKRAKRT